MIILTIIIMIFAPIACRRWPGIGKGIKNFKDSTKETPEEKS